MQELAQGPNGRRHIYSPYRLSVLQSGQPIAVSVQGEELAFCYSWLPQNIVGSPPAACSTAGCQQAASDVPGSKLCGRACSSSSAAQPKQLGAMKDHFKTLPTRIMLESAVNHPADTAHSPTVGPPMSSLFWWLDQEMTTECTVCSVSTAKLHLQILPDQPTTSHRGLVLPLAQHKVQQNIFSLQYDYAPLGFYSYLQSQSNAKH